MARRLQPLREPLKSHSLNTTLEKTGSWWSRGTLTNKVVRQKPTLDNIITLLSETQHFTTMEHIQKALSHMQILLCPTNRQVMEVYPCNHNFCSQRTLRIPI